MSAKTSKIRFVKGIIYRIIGSNRQGIETLLQANDALSDEQNFGLNSCDQSLRLIDTVTGNVGVIQVTNGELVLTMTDCAGTPVSEG